MLKTKVYDLAQRLVTLDQVAAYIQAMVEEGCSISEFKDVLALANSAVDQMFESPTDQLEYLYNKEWLPCRALGYEISLQSIPIYYNVPVMGYGFIPHAELRYADSKSPVSLNVTRVSDFFSV